MKTLIKHLIENNFEEILAKSFLNCHVEGVHSLMLLDSPGKTIRLYIADTNHKLSQNNSVDVEVLPLTAALHAHHCNLTLHCIHGQILNWGAKESDKGIKLKKYLHHSKILKGAIQFEKIADESYLETTNETFLNVGDSLSLKASDIHTIAAMSERVASWLVYAGKEDENYIPYCWSNVELQNEDYSVLYQKPTEQDIHRLLSLIGL
jgi:hypothetical protein